MPKLRCWVRRQTVIFSAVGGDHAMLRPFIVFHTDAALKAVPRRRIAEARAWRCPERWSGAELFDEVLDAVESEGAVPKFHAVRKFLDDQEASDQSIADAHIWSACCIGSLFPACPAIYSCVDPLCRDGQMAPAAATGLLRFITCYSDHLCRGSRQVISY